jgi:hypothetical protein
VPGSPKLSSDDLLISMIFSDKSPVISVFCLSKNGETLVRAIHPRRRGEAAFEKSSACLLLTISKAGKFFNVVLRFLIAPN